MTKKSEAAIVRAVAMEARDKKVLSVVKALGEHEAEKRLQQGIAPIPYLQAEKITKEAWASFELMRGETMASLTRLVKAGSVYRRRAYDNVTYCTTQAHEEWEAKREAVYAKDKEDRVRLQKVIDSILEATGVTVHPYLSSKREEREPEAQRWERLVRLVNAGLAVEARNARRRKARK